MSNTHGCLAWHQVHAFIGSCYIWVNSLSTVSATKSFSSLTEDANEAELNRRTQDLFLAALEPSDEGI